MNKRFFLFLLVLVLAAVSLQSADQTAARQSFEKYVQVHMAQDHVPGMVFGFMKDDTVWVKAFGYSDLENQVPARETSAYRLASLTKSMTATAILQLVEAGKVNLDAEVQKYVPYFPKKPWPITIRQLLGHLGGISHYKNYEEEGHIKEHKNTREAIAIFENFDLVAEPGTKFSYSSYGYNLLGAVVEAASGQSYGDYMREHVWKVAGMSDTRMDDPLDLIPNRVRGYQLVHGQIANSGYVDVSSRFAAGGTRSTVPDLLKYGKALIDGKLLSPQSFDLMTTSMTTKDGRLTDYGTGWDVRSPDGHFAITHTGGQAETSTVLYIFPKIHLVMAGATNLEEGGPSMYVRRLFQLLLDEPWNRTVYANDRNTVALIRGMQSVYDDGLAYYEKYGKPMTQDPTELARSFRYFNNILSSSGKDKSKLIDDGREPMMHQPFVQMGSFMGLQLQGRRSSPFAFFGDFIQAYRKQSGISHDLRFPSSFEKQVAQWNQSWEQTNSRYIRDLDITIDSNFQEMGPVLKKTFSGANIYPDLTGSFADVVQRLADAGKVDHAIQAARLSADLYPASDTSLSTLAVALVMQGNREEATQALKKASAIDSERNAGPSGLDSTASELSDNGQDSHALMLLEIAVDLYPRNADLYDSLGQLSLKMEQKEKAIQYFKKALELDPGMESSKKMLETLSH